MSAAGQLPSDAVAVIMPVRNCERYVADALESILSQRTAAAEVIVVDDASTDGTPTVLEGFGDSVHVIRQEPAGQFVAMNRGIEASRAPVLAFLDADDLYTADSIAVRLARLAADDSPEAVFGRTEQFISPELSVEEAAQIRYEAGPVRGELFQTMMIRRVAFDRVGLVGIDRATSGNIDWISRARAAGLRSVRIPDVVARRRLHTSNIGVTAREQKRRDLLSVVRAHRQRNERPGSA